MFKIIDKVISYISEPIAAIGIFSGVLLAFINVIGRYVFNKSFTWASELTMYFFLWSIFFGTVYCFKKDAHISINILLEKVPKKISKVLMIISSFISIIFLLAVAYYGFKYIQLVIEIDEKSVDLDIPMWIPYLVIPISFTFSGYRVIEKLFYTIKTPANMLKITNEGDELLKNENQELVRSVEKKTGGLL